MKRIFLLVSLIVTPSAVMLAQNNSWIDGDGKWETGTNWSLGSAPSSSDSADLITNAGNNTVTIDATTSSSYPASMTINKLTISSPLGSVNTLELTNSGMLSLSELLLGDRSALVLQNSAIDIGGTFKVGGTVSLKSGATLFGPAPQVGSYPFSSSGAIWVSGGAFIATSGTMRLGGFEDNDGLFTISNGIAQVDGLTLDGRRGLFGVPAGGRLTVAGGTMTVRGSADIAASSNGWGAVQVTGGQLIAGDINMDQSTDSSGFMTVLNGVVLGGGLAMGAGLDSSATLTIAGGTVDLSSNITMSGLNPSGHATIWVTGGQLIVTNSAPFGVIDVGTAGMADGAISHLIVSNGTVMAREIFVGNGTYLTKFARGIITVAGGTVSILAGTNGLVVGTGWGDAAGQVEVTGGQLLFGDAPLFIGKNGSGMMTLSNGTVMAQHVLIAVGTNSLGTLAVSAGSKMSILSNFIAGAGVGSTATVSIVGGQLVVTNGVFGIGNTGTITDGSGTGTMTVSNGTVVCASMVLGSTNGGSGTLYIQRGGLVQTLCGRTLNDEVVDGGTDQVIENSGADCSFEDVNLHNRIVAGYLRDGALTVTNGGTVIAPEIVIGLTNGTGRLNLVDGTVTATRNFYVGMNLNSTGTVTVTGGSLTVTNGVFGVGNTGTLTDGKGTGTMTVSNGTVVCASMVLGSTKGGSGTLYIQRGGLVQTLCGRMLNDEVVDGGTDQVIENSGADCTFEDMNLHNRIVAGYLRDGALTVTNGGTVIAPEIVIGLTNGTGRLNLADGTVTVTRNLYVGMNLNSTGTVTITGGSLTVTNGVIGVGNTGTLTDGRGTGTMTVTNGTVVCASMVLGSTKGGSGTLYIQRGGLVQTLCGRSLNDEVVDGGTDQVIENSGADCSFEDVNLHNRIVAGYLRDGALTVTNGGTVIAPEIVIGLTNGTGRLNLADGTVTVTRNLYVGMNLNSTGTVTITGGSLTATNGVIGIGSDGGVTNGTGVGSMYVSNATVMASIIGMGSRAGGRGYLTLAAGGQIKSICTNGILYTGEFGQIGGDLSWTNIGSAMYCGYAHPGAYTLSNGTSSCQDVYVGYDNSGTMTVAGGAMSILSRLTVGHLGSPMSTGAVWITGGQLTMVNQTAIIGNSGVGQMTISNGIMTASSVVVGNNGSNPGTLTVAGGAMTVLSGLTVGDCGAGYVGALTITSGNLYVTNATHDATLDVRSGRLTLNGGQLKVDKLVMTNTCGVLIRGGGTLIYGQAVLDPIRDDDGDGIPNGWEQSHGLDPFNAADANADPDGDGISNLQEYLAGTDPNDPNSTPFRITTIARQSNDVRITWSTFGGMTNVVQATTGGPGGGYSNNFCTLAPPIIIPGSSLVSTNCLDVGGITSSLARYYRVSLVTTQIVCPPGLVWTASTQSWTCVAVSADGTKLVAGTYFGYLYTSTDCGATWTPRASSRAWQSIASSADGNKLVAAGQYGASHDYHSTDYGVTWWQANPGWGNLSVVYVASSGDGTKLVAANNGGAIRTSADSGVTWTVVTNVPDAYWNSVASSADGTKLVAVASLGFIWTSTDSGVTWTARTSTQQQWQSVASSTNGTKLVAVIYGGMIYTSTDSGVTWTPRGSSQNWTSVASSADGAKLAAGTDGNQMYTSSDSGVTWTPRGGSHHWTSVALSADGTKVIGTVANGQIYVSCCP